MESLSTLTALLDPLVASKGCSVYGIEWDKAMKPPVLRVMIDKEDGEVDLDLCVACSELISEKLD